MSKIKERAGWWLDAFHHRDGTTNGENLAAGVITDLLAELSKLDQRVAELEQISAPIINGDVNAELARLNQRIAELEAENSRLNALLHKSSQKSAEDFAEYVEEARMQAVMDVLVEIDNMRFELPDFVVQHVKNHFSLECGV